MAKDIVKFVIALLVGWFVATVFIAPLLGVAVAGFSGILFTVGLLMLAKGLGLFDVDPLGLSKQMALYAGIALVVIVIGVGTVLSAITGFFSGAGVPAATIAAVSGPAAIGSCADSVNPDNLGDSATADINAYDFEADSPLASAVDVNPTNIYKAASASGATSGNFISALTDTSANTANLEQGSVYSFFGGSASYYLEPLEGVCVSSARPSVSLRGYAAAGDTNLQTTVYDSTGATALSAGSNLGNADYLLTLGSNEESNIEWKIKVNAANKAYWLAAISTLGGTNISWVKPTGNSASLFVDSATPQHMKDQVITTNTSITVTRTYSAYKLIKPVLLHEFEDRQYRLSVKATGDPSSGSVAATDSGFVALLAKDAVWLKGADGKAYFDIHDHTATEADVGCAEVETSPNGKTSGAIIEVA